MIDYTREDFAINGKTYDIIFGTVGNRTFSNCQGSLTEHGVFLTTGVMPGNMLHVLWTSRTGGKRAMFAATGLRPAREKAKDLVFLTELIESGKLKAVIDRCYPLEQIIDAHKYVAKGHKKGNVVITMPVGRSGTNEH